MAAINRSRNREVLSQLMEKASVQGYLNTDDMLDAGPDLGEDAEHLSVLMLALRHRGVDMLDSDTDPQPTEVLAAPDLTPWLDPEEVDYSSDDSVGMYLKEMSRVPLLKANEEYEIAVRIELAEEDVVDAVRCMVINLGAGIEIHRVIEAARDIHVARRVRGDRLTDILRGTAEREGESESRCGPRQSGIQVQPIPPSHSGSRKAVSPRDCNMRSLR